MAEAIATLLDQLGRGDAGALERLVPLLYDELRALARAQRRRLHGGRALDTTELVHETYLKLRGARVPARDAGHLMGILARAMRQVLVDAARQRVAAKRGGEHAAEPLADDFGIDPPRAEELLDVEHALARLGRLDERLVRVVECRFFVGLTEEETGAALGRSARTVHRDWLRARAWLRRELGRSGPVAAAGGGSREGGAVGPGHGRGGGSA